MKVSSSKHWSEYSRNPISEEAQGVVRKQLSDARKDPITDMRRFWTSEVSGKCLLDIGVVEHSLELAEREGWRHAIFARLARKAVGVDILAEEVRILREKGYDLRVCDATSDADIEERFDLVYIGDVIEHVDDPVRLLRFAARHLQADGKILVSTPCPYWWRNIRLMLSDGTFIGNVDHVRWVLPVNALEIAHRAGIRLSGYRTIDTPGKSIYFRLGQRIINLMLGKGELFTWAYMYEFKLLIENEDQI